MSDRLIYGLDFGTSNSAIAILVDEKIRVLPIGANGSKIMSSILFFPENEKQYYIGSDAMFRYVDGGMKGRMMQSIKAFLPDPSFTKTVIRGFGVFTLEELISLIMSNIKKKADSLIGHDIKEVVLGRPALFSNNEKEDEIAECRLRDSAQMAGFEKVHFQKEPVAAALHYATMITSPELVLVVDLGGGTSDFTLVRIYPRKPEEEPKADILGINGINIGGNDFDSEIMWHKLVKYFGRNVRYKTMSRWLDMPVHLMRSLCTWHRIPLLKDSHTREFFRELLNSSDDRKSIIRLSALVEENLGFSLFQIISDAKCGLSVNEIEEIAFRQSVIDISELIHRFEFEEMISGKIKEIGCCIDGLLLNAGLDISSVDSVFLTGGTSYVPAVRKSLEVKFGSKKLQSGDVFTSVVSGLALSSKLF
ncbi:MAG: putative chaperone protein [Planctomycetota bacterium]